MRILFVIQELRTGGAERVVVALARGARSAGHDVAVAAAPGPLADELGAPVFPLPLLRRRPWLVPLTALRVRQALAAWPAELVHCHNPGMAAATSLATIRGRRPPALVSIHGVRNEDYRVAARVLRLAGLPAVACGLGVEVALAEQRYDVVATIPNGIPPAPPPGDRAELDREWGLAPEQRLVVLVGRLVDQKNQGLAIAALAEIPGATLAVLGEGPLRASLEREALHAGIADRVVFAGVRHDAREIIGAADAVVIPSRFEGLPLVALEALAARTPIVATAVRGLRELLTDGETALLVPPGDARLLAAALRRVLEEDVLAERLAEAGLRVAAEYTEERMVNGYLTLYNHLLAEGRDGR
jgi:glycosyltransferase involved in cell wall biosynthesis